MSGADCEIFSQSEGLFEGLDVRYSLRVRGCVRS